MSEIQSPALSEIQPPARTARLIDIDVAMDRLAPAFAGVASRVPESVFEANYLFAGHPVRVRIAGKRLAADVDRALHYVRAPDDIPPALTIEVWDDAEVGPLGLFSWPEDADYHGLVSVTDDARFVLNQRPSSVLLLDREKNRIVGSIRGRDALFQDERARPFHLLVSIWLADRDIPFIHAALVGQDDKGLLFAGKSGSGKTTSSIACYVGGLTYLSDDCVALEKTAEGKFVGHSIYATCMHDDIKRFPTLASIAHGPNHSFEKKDSVYLLEHDADRFASRIDLAGIVIPKLCDRIDTTHRRAKTMEAMLALAPSSLWMLPNAANASLEKLDGLLTTVPAFWLELGRDVDQVAPAVKRLFSDLSDA
jgi:hypothetical protein